MSEHWSTHTVWPDYEFPPGKDADLDALNEMLPDDLRLIVNDEGVYTYIELEERLDSGSDSESAPDECAQCHGIGFVSAQIGGESTTFTCDACGGDGRV